MHYLLFDQKDGVGLLTINRPESLNALNRVVLQEMEDFLTSMAHSNDLRALILTGSGEKAFIAGADIKEMQSLSHLEMLEFCELGQRVSHHLENAHYPTIAAVNGYALGGGLEMALACDFIYASENAKLGLPEVTLGIIPGFGGTQRLSRSVGTRQAKEMIFTGKSLTALEAQKIGLVNEVCSTESLIQNCISIAKQIAKFSSVAVREGKLAINHGYSLGIHEALELERQMFAVSFATEERKQAMADFVEKKKT